MTDGKGNASDSNYTGCDKEFERRTAGVRDMGKPIVCYDDESDLCYACEEETWHLTCLLVKLSNYC